MKSSLKNGQKKERGRKKEEIKDAKVEVADNRGDKRGKEVES